MHDDLSLVKNFLPAPFEWCEIPAGKVTLEEGGYLSNERPSFDVPSFYIAKYPVTNAQFAKFIEVGGYNQQKWWTEAGWQQKQGDNWIEPRYWNDSKYNDSEQPVTSVSWYEAIAFCHWLNESIKTQDVAPDARITITLPTEQQWQRAAQGDDGRVYPWGNAWDATRCNNDVARKGIGKTSLVTAYEGRGDSPYGVVDMAGNVYEWCLTDFEIGSNDINGAKARIMHGGSWGNSLNVVFRCGLRFRADSELRSNGGGFRIAYA